MKEYIVVYFSEDGVDLRYKSRTELYEFLEEAVELECEFLSEIPKDSNYVDNKYLIIKGNLVVPRARAVATEYEID